MKIYDALKLAVEELERREDVPQEEYRLTASKAEDRWVFWFVFLPPTPGRDLTVTVTEAGEVEMSWGI